jgi:STAM-binding protein
MRSVIVPQDLTPTFLRIAKSNSDRGIETLGTLGGSLRNNRLVISHLVIPRQTGKSDSCTMEGLEDVWDVHDRENIIFLGWIHTHPEYDVFLSSVDMHNQYEWQHMLPEALAIVCRWENRIVLLTPPAVTQSANS